ncbi:MAG: type II toxin-antitoxin system RatA family toxin [Alphaproteobacteria bacterium]|nr:type II toxin-antitoxin system RatA family toxin [Alphaproteobacteria bacterium]
MINHKEIYFSEFSVKQLFDLVKDIESYPDFLPWCSAARIIESSNSKIIAELVVHFASFHEKYTSEVHLTLPDKKETYARIDVTMLEGPFKKLENTWIFEYDDNKKQTKISFDISFEFKSFLLQKMIGSLFESSLKKMMVSFEKRAREIYT